VNNRTIHGMPAVTDAALANEQLAMLARTPSAPDPAAAPARVLRSLVFMRAGGRWFALPAEAVTEVTTKGAIARVPGTPRTILGLTLVRGRLVPVISLTELVGFLPAGELAATLPRLVIVRGDDSELAVVADEIKGVIEHAGVGEERAHATDRPAFLGEELAWKGRLACLVDVRSLIAAVQRGTL
jgi:chemotaxis signal transduction protein